MAPICEGSDQQWRAQIAAKGTYTEPEAAVPSAIRKHMRLKFDELQPQLQNFCTGVGSLPTKRILKGKLEESFNENRDGWLDELDEVIKDLRLFSRSDFARESNLDLCRHLDSADLKQLSEWALGFDFPNGKEHQISVEPTDFRIYWEVSPVIRAEYRITATNPQERQCSKDTEPNGPIKVAWRCTYTCQWPLSIEGPRCSVSDRGGHKGKDSTYDQVRSELTQAEQSENSLKSLDSDLNSSPSTVPSQGNTASNISGEGSHQ